MDQASFLIGFAVASKLAQASGCWSYWWRWWCWWWRRRSKVSFAWFAHKQTWRQFAMLRPHHKREHKLLVNYIVLLQKLMARLYSAHSDSNWKWMWIEADDLFASYLFQFIMVQFNRISYLMVAIIEIARSTNLCNCQSKIRCLLCFVLATKYRLLRNIGAKSSSSGSKLKFNLYPIPNRADHLSFTKSLWL